MKPSITKGKLALSALLWLGLWQCVSLWLGTELLLPSPVHVLERLVFLSCTSTFWLAVCVSSGRIVSGFVVALVSGCVLAVAAQRFSAVDDVLSAPLACMKTVPVASFIVLAQVWVPTQSLAGFIAFLMAFPVIYTNVGAGLTQADTSLLEMAQVFSVPPGRTLRCVILPSVSPHLQAGSTLAMGLCWKAGVAAEFIGLPKGTMGRSLYQAKIYFEVPDLFAWTVAVVAISLLWTRLFRYFLSWICKKAVQV